MTLTGTLCFYLPGIGSIASLSLEFMVRVEGMKVVLTFYSSFLAVHCIVHRCHH